jgi:hypothetical protein
MPFDEALVLILPNVHSAIHDIGGADGDLVTASRVDIGGQVAPFILVDAVGSSIPPVVTSL